MNWRKPANPEQSGKNTSNKLFDLTLARKMLPLVKSIVHDIVQTQLQLRNLDIEQDHLDRKKRTLNWVERQRRYAVQEAVSNAEAQLSAAVSELSALGVRLLDPKVGAIEFPTKINGRPAAFQWQLGQDSVAVWHYEEEQTQRPIPADWQTGTPLRRTNP